MKNKKCCETCGHVICYKIGKTRFECAEMTVSPNGICDRWQKDCSPAEIMRLIDKKLIELEKCEDGKYELTKRPAYHQNYHLIEAA